MKDLDAPSRLSVKTGSWEEVTTSPYYYRYFDCLDSRILGEVHIYVGKATFSGWNLLVFCSGVLWRLPLHGTLGHRLPNLCLELGRMPAFGN